MISLSYQFNPAVIDILGYQVAVMTEGMTSEMAAVIVFEIIYSSPVAALVSHTFFCAHLFFLLTDSSHP